jgi:hypothetical protein
MFPEDALAGYRQSFKRKVRAHAGAFLYMHGLGGTDVSTAVAEQKLSAR